MTTTSRSISSSTGAWTRTTSAAAPVFPATAGLPRALGDLNRDGFTDLVVVNGRNGIKSNLDSFIYWGGAQGFAVERRAELPTLGGMAAAVADLNGDGYPEIVFANSSGAGGRPSGPENASFLYWGSKDGFSIERRQSLPTAAATDVAIADLDRDGSHEIVFANEGSGANLGGAMIYWGGSPEGVTRQIGARCCPASEARPWPWPTSTATRFPRSFWPTATVLSSVNRKTAASGIPTSTANRYLHSSTGDPARATAPTAAWRYPPLRPAAWRREISTRTGCLIWSSPTAPRNPAMPPPDRGAARPFSGTARRDSRLTAEPSCPP